MPRDPGLATHAKDVRLTWSRIRGYPSKHPYVHLCPVLNARSCDNCTGAPHTKISNHFVLRLLWAVFRGAEVTAFDITK